jgi:tRNA threonylcarbamoyl adenosine modification protein YeaZ
MLLLFDTSTRTAVVALADAEGMAVLGERAYEPDRGGSAMLLDGARHLLVDAGSSLDALTGVIVNKGPGSYTGLRIGYALAQGLSESRQIPIVGIPSFQAIADQHRKREEALIVCYDARTRGLAWITYQAGHGGPQLARDGAILHSPSGLHDRLIVGGRPVAVTVAPVAALPGLIPRPCRIAGPGVGVLLKQMEEEPPEDLDVISDSDRPNTASLFRLGAGQIQAGGEDPTDVEPLYLGNIVAPVPRSSA